MSSVCLIDTSVFTNLLNVPGRNQHKEDVTQAYQEYVELGCTFILPMATIIETGNHIAQNGDGRVRRETAQRFVIAVKAAFEGSAPWSPSDFPSAAEILTWLDTFPDHAGRNKAPDKPNEGTSFGDLSIIQEFEKCCRRFAMSEVFIWSLDSDVQQKHRVVAKR
jgi:hypothetical protein